MSAVVGAGAWGDGVGTFTAAQVPLEFFFASPRLGSPPESALAAGVDRSDAVRGVHMRVERVVIDDLDDPPLSTADGYLRLHLLSHRLVRPNELNLDGIFAVLPNVCWTSIGPVDPADLPAVRTRATSYLQVRSVDKFPRMLDYVVPSGVRIADADRVRLGAYLSEGTVVMHEGFVNFNAGTLGTAMVEGRISQGVLVGDGTDIGGGASILGTLSGGGKEIVSMGERCLLGANAGLGIALGDDCVVEAGLYLTAGTLVSLPDGMVVKAKELSGHSGLLFRRHSQTGKVEALARSGSWGGLNKALH